MATKKELVDSVRTISGRCQDDNIRVAFRYLCDAMEADMGESPQAVAAQIGERLRAAGKLPLDAVAEAWRIIYTSEASLTVSQKADLHKEIMTLIRREVADERERAAKWADSYVAVNSIAKGIAEAIRSGE